MSKIAPSRLHVNPKPKLPQVRVEKHGTHKGNRISVLSHPDRRGLVEIYDPSEGHVSAEYKWVLMKTKPVKNPPLATHVARGECKPTKKGKKILKNPRTVKTLGSVAGAMSRYDGNRYWWAYSRVRNRQTLGDAWNLVACESVEQAKEIEGKLRAHIHKQDKFGSVVGRTSRPVTLHELQLEAAKGKTLKERKSTSYRVTILANHSATARDILGL